MPVVCCPATTNPLSGRHPGGGSHRHVDVASESHHAVDDGRLGAKEVPLDVERGERARQVGQQISDR